MEDHQNSSPAPEVAAKYEFIQEECFTSHQVKSVVCCAFILPFAVVTGTVLYEATMVGTFSSYFYAVLINALPFYLLVMFLWQALNPITKQVIYLDRSRIVTVDQFRVRGQKRLLEVPIPLNAKVYVLEGSATTNSSEKPSRWRLFIGSSNRDQSIFELPQPKSREEAAQVARQIADLLNIEVVVETKA